MKSRRSWGGARLRSAYSWSGQPPPPSPLSSHFGLGEDARHNAPTDLAGVALAEAEEETQALREANREMRTRIDELEELADGLLDRLAALGGRAGAPE